MVQEQYLVMADKQHCLLLSLPRAEWYRTRGQLAPLQQPLKSQPLLVPLAMKLEPSLIQVSEDIFELLTSFGIELKARGGNSLMVMGVPQPLRQHNLQNLIPDMLTFAAQNLASSISPRDELADWLAHQVVKTKSNYTLSEAIQLVAEAEQVWQGNLPFDDRSLVTPIDFTATIAALNYE